MSIVPNTNLHPETTDPTAQMGEIPVFPMTEQSNDSNDKNDRILCFHCRRTATNGIKCKGICVADNDY